MAIIIPANTLASGGYAVDNSCRFDGSSAYMHKTPGGAGNLRTFTISFWVKRSSLGQMWMFQQGADNGTDTTYLRFTPTHQLSFADYSAGGEFELATNRLFRDFSAWYHIVVAVDTTQGTAANRVKIYVNGVQETSFATETYPSENYDTELNGTDLLTLCRRVDDGGSPQLYYNGYLAETVMVDGTALAPTSFGEFDEDSGIWKPIDVSGLTFGTNGFYLDFENSGALGADVSGNTNNFTVNNLTAIDQTTDTPTNNFATLNPLGMPSTNTTFSEGNLTVNVASGSSFFSIPTIGVSSGKWYVEGKLVTANTAGGVYYTDYGFSDRPNSAGELLYASSGRVFWLSNWDSKINYRTGGSTTAGLQTGKTGLSEGDFFQLYLDMDNELMYWGRNGSVTNSTGISFNGKESLTGEYFFAFGDQYTSGTHKYSTNFGQGSIDGSAVSSYNDVNGYGNFKYNPTVSTDEGSKDFLALCTKNLAEYG